MSTTSTSPPRLGRCPACRSEIASLDVRILEGDRPRVLTECPTCRRRVTPE